MTARQILIIDDEEAVCWALKRAFERAGHRVAVASSAEEGLDAAKAKRPDAVLLDVRLPGMDGLEALGRLQKLTSDAPVIVITAHGNLSTAVRAVEGGAFDYLAKPFDLSQAEANGQPARTDEIIGRSPPMQRVFKQIALVAARDACVLITGESGTGK